MRNHPFSFLLFVVCSIAVSGTVSAAAAVCRPCGSGAQGAYTATSDTTLPGGIYDFTTFNIDAGVTVTVTGPDPLVIRATDVVTINGNLVAAGAAGGDGVISSNAGLGAPAAAGGSPGGDGVYSDSLGPLPGSDGSGAGAGFAGASWNGGGGAGYGEDGLSSGGGGGGAGGLAFGTPNIPVLIGGSGGGGGSGGYSCGSGGGGAGGGAILIRSCVSIVVGATALMSTNGGNGGSDGLGNCGGGGGASGGSVVLEAPDLTVDGTVSSLGGKGGASAVSGDPYYGTGGDGGKGRIHLETETGATKGVGTVDPAAQLNECPIFADSFELY